jgi:mRNA interferase RelE/StbE
MKYTVVLERQVIKQLAGIPNPARKKIQEALRSLAENPRPHGYLKLKGREGYRIRVNDYRIVYNIKDDVLTVYVLLIGNRKNVYD